MSAIKNNQLQDKAIDCIMAIGISNMAMIAIEQNYGKKMGKLAKRLHFELIKASMEMMEADGSDKEAKMLLNEVFTKMLKAAKGIQEIEGKKKK